MATIKDIATLANVSSASVSRILNLDMSISVTPETRQKVIDIANDLGYVKKPKNTNKVSNSPFVVGIVQWYSLEQELEDPYYLSVRLGAEKYCNELGATVIRCFKSDSDLSLINQVDGLICIGKFSEQEIILFKSKSNNIIFIDLVSEAITENSIVLDFKKAMEDSLDYLYQLNHRSIGYLGGKEFSSGGDEVKDARLTIYLEYLKRLGLDYQNNIKLGYFTSQSGYQMMKEWIATGTLPTAIFAASDPIAIGALKALQEANIKVPEDISLFGFDDIQAASYSFPPLTTMHAPSLEMGDYAARLIISKSLVGTLVPIKIHLPCQLIERESCKQREEKYES